MDGSIVAWSISRGMVIYDVKHILRDIFHDRLPLPTLRWIQDRAKYVAKWPSDSEGLWRKTINFGVLLLAKHGIVATTKYQLRRDFSVHIQQPLLRAAVDLVTARHRKERVLLHEDIRMLGEAVSIFASELCSS